MLFSSVTPTTPRARGAGPMVSLLRSHDDIDDLNSNSVEFTEAMLDTYTLYIFHKRAEREQESLSNLPVTAISKKSD